MTEARRHLAAYPEAQQELRDDFEFADGDRNGRISLDEFVTWWTQD